MEDFMNSNYDLNNLMATAVSEMENGQYEEAAKHFDTIVVNDGSNYKAAFYRIYCKCYVGKLGDIPNQAINLTNAFSLFLKKLENEEETEKELCIKDALEKIAEVSYHFAHNAKRTMLIAPTVGMSINRANKTMFNNCITIAKNYNVKIDEETENILLLASKKSSSTGKILIIVIAVGAIIWLLSYLFTFI
jgi:hypothetical protein